MALHVFSRRGRGVINVVNPRGFVRSSFGDFWEVTDATCGRKILDKVPHIRLRIFRPISSCPGRRDSSQVELERYRRRVSPSQTKGRKGLVVRCAPVAREMWRERFHRHIFHLKDEVFQKNRHRRNPLKPHTARVIHRWHAFDEMILMSIQQKNFPHRPRVNIIRTEVPCTWIETRN